jgi:hypothetical protein
MRWGIRLFNTPGTPFVGNQGRLFPVIVLDGCNHVVQHSKFSTFVHWTPVDFGPRVKRRLRSKASLFVANDHFRAMPEPAQRMKDGH